MDTSEIYIKMCEKAGEIQRLHFGTEEENDFYWCSIRATTLEEGKKIGYAIWLPRQDQLQKMVGDFEGQIKEALYWLYSDEMELVTSFEQWWLRVVMRQKYNKFWDGEDWIKGVYENQTKKDRH